METSSFWLIYVQENSVVVSLICQKDNRYQILATGPKKKWQIDSEESFVSAIDESLSGASLNANISEDQEPENGAFVVPPFWINNDGKINAPKLKLIKSVCKDLKINPSGFIPEDEAIVEEANQKDGFPASFIILHLDNSEFYLSLVYLGHIKERIRKNFDGDFSGKTLESSLLEFNSDSTLPPQILIFGQVDDTLLSSLKNYPWTGKKDVETFLHFPEIKNISDQEILTTFTHIITNSQLQQTPSPEEVIVEDDNPPEKKDTEELSLEEVDPELFGFATDISSDNLSKEFFQNQPSDVSVEPNLDPFVPENLPSPVATPNKLPKIKISLSFLKKIKFPKIKSNNILWILLAVLPIAIIIPILLSKSKVTLFVTPYQFIKQTAITFKTNTDDSSISQLIVPVEKQVFDLTTQASLATTGQKTIGEKAKGEIIVYNKIDKSQNIPQGAILSDSSGKSFELTTAISVASSSSNLNEGVINLGQTKTAAIASDIGSEFNITKDTQLKFKDFADTIVIAKTNQEFTGGSKRQINAVSSQDKEGLTEKVNQEINKAIDEKVNTDLQNTSGVIKETIQTKKNQLDFSREVGEEADELSVTAKSSVTVFTIKDDVKEKLIKQILADQPDFEKIDFDVDNFTITFKVNKIDNDKATGELTVQGSSLPKIDLSKLKKNISGKTDNRAGEIIKKTISRVYNFNIQNNFPLGLLPFKRDNIDIEIKSESL